VKNILSLIVIIVSISFTACGGGGDGEVVVVHAVNYTPELKRFDVVDSYGIDTREPGTTPLTIDPYADNGLFDVFWRVNSLEDYRVNIRINDRAGVNNSLLIYSEICGLGRACDQGSGVICEYTDDYWLSCNNNRAIDIYPLFPLGAPEKQYLVLEICDLDSTYCAYDYYSVWMK
jgi:hypothetical protein